MTPRMEQIYKDVFSEHLKTPPLKRLKSSSCESLPSASPNSAGESLPHSSPDSLVKALSFEVEAAMEDSDAAAAQVQEAQLKAKKSGGRPVGRSLNVGRKIEVPIAAQLKIAYSLEAALPEYADETSFWRDMKKRFGKPVKFLKQVLNQKEKMQKLVQSKSLSAKPLLYVSGSLM